MQSKARFFVVHEFFTIGWKAKKRGGGFMGNNRVVESLLFLVVGFSIFICASPVEATVVAYWQMDEATSGRIITLADSSGGYGDVPARDLDNQLGWAEYVAADVNSPMAANGVAVPGNVAYMEVGGTQGMFDQDPNWYDDTSYTLEVFYRRTDIDSSGALLGNGHSNGYEGIGYIAVLDNGNIEIQLVGGDVGTQGNSYDIISADGPDDGAWHHLAYTFNNGTIKIYVDYKLAGIAITTYYRGRVFNDYAYMQVGWANAYPGGAGINGYLDELRISDTILAPNEFLGSNVNGTEQEICDDVWDFGFGMDADRDKDCVITFRDFARFASDWATVTCNKPDDINCIPNW